MIKDEFKEDLKMNSDFFDDEILKAFNDYYFLDKTGTFFIDEASSFRHFFAFMVGYKPSISIYQFYYYVNELKSLAFRSWGEKKLKNNFNGGNENE
jgi:hypothetical protein